LGDDRVIEAAEPAENDGGVTAFGYGIGDIALMVQGSDAVQVKVTIKFSFDP
jgi:hypothetical protein